MGPKAMPCFATIIGEEQLTPTAPFLNNSFKRNTLLNTSKSRIFDFLDLV